MSGDRRHRSRDRVEIVLAERRSELLDEVRRRYRRGAHPLFTERSKRTLAGMEACFANLVPILHLWRCAHGEMELLRLLRSTCWEIGVYRGFEIEEGLDFECVLLRWAHDRPSDWDPAGAAPAPGEAAAAVAARLRTARLWKLAWGFVPVVGPIAAYRIDGALAARFYDLARAYFRERGSLGERTFEDRSGAGLPRPAGVV